MMELGAVNALMSGSGPTVFGLFVNPAAAQDAYEEMRYGTGSHLVKQVYLTSFYNVTVQPSAKLQQNDAQKR